MSPRKRKVVLGEVSTNTTVTGPTTCAVRKPKLVKLIGKLHQHLPKLGSSSQNDRIKELQALNAQWQCSCSKCDKNAPSSKGKGNRSADADNLTALDGSLRSVTLVNSSDYSYARSVDVGSMTLDENSRLDVTRVDSQSFAWSERRVGTCQPAGLGHLTPTKPPVSGCRRFRTGRRLDADHLSHLTPLLSSRGGRKNCSLEPRRARKKGPVDFLANEPVSENSCSDDSTFCDKENYIGADNDDDEGLTSFELHHKPLFCDNDYDEVDDNTVVEQDVSSHGNAFDSMDETIPDETILGGNVRFDRTLRGDAVQTIPSEQSLHGGRLCSITSGDGGTTCLVHGDSRINECLVNSRCSEFLGCMSFGVKGILRNKVSQCLCFVYMYKLCVCLSVYPLRDVAFSVSFSLSR